MRNVLRIGAALAIGAVALMFTSTVSLMALGAASFAVVLLAAQETDDTMDFVEENLHGVEVLTHSRSRPVA